MCSLHGSGTGPGGHGARRLSACNRHLIFLRCGSPTLGRTGCLVNVGQRSRINITVTKPGPRSQLITQRRLPDLLGLGQVSVGRRIFKLTSRRLQKEVIELVIQNANAVKLKTAQTSRWKWSWRRIGQKMAGFVDRLGRSIAPNESRPS